MSESAHEHGVGKTGGLPGSNADPAAAFTSDDELDEVQHGAVAPDDGVQRDV